MLVWELGPSDAISVLESTPCLQVASLMAAKRTDAVLIVNLNGELTGIATDKDLTYRLIAKRLDPTNTPVSAIMTWHPVAVSQLDHGKEALNKMVSGGFKHLPVTPDPSLEDPEQNIWEGKCHFGMLDVTKCLRHVLTHLDAKAAGYTGDEDDTSSSHSSLTVFAKKVQRKLNLPQLEGLVSDQVKLMPLGCTVMEAVLAMVNARETAVLIYDDSIVSQNSFKTSNTDTSKEDAQDASNQHRDAIHSSQCVDDKRTKMVGIFTTKDLVLRVIAAGLHPERTLIQRVMTPNPDAMSPHTTLFQALEQMHQKRYHHLPIVDGDRVVGLADILKLTYTTLDELTWSQDQLPWTNLWDTMVHTSLRVPVDSEMICPDESASIIRSDTSDTIDEDTFLFKFKDFERLKTHRRRGRCNDLSGLIEFVYSKQQRRRFNEIRLVYMDDEGDMIRIHNERDLEDAVLVAKAAGWRSLLILIDKTFTPPQIQELFCVSPLTLGMLISASVVASLGFVLVKLALPTR